MKTNFSPVNTAFSRAVRLRESTPGRYELTLDPIWRQGPGVVGGLQAALLLRSMITHINAPERLVRTLTVHFVSPARPGAAWCEVEVVRAGRSLSNVAARLVGEQGVIATAMATFATARPVTRGASQPPMPSAPPWQDVAPAQHGAPPPEFTQLCLFRDCLGSAVYSGAAEARLGGWGRLAEIEPLIPAYLTLLADAWPPAMLACYDRVRPVASIAMTIDFHAGAGGHGLPAGTPVLYDVRGTATTQGYCEESATMWAPDGRLLLTVRQQVLMFAGN